MAIDGISRELVEKADCGLYTDPGNPQDLAEKVKIYLNDTVLAKIQGENGYAFGKKHFDRRILALEYLEELQKLAANHG